MSLREKPRRKIIEVALREQARDNANARKAEVSDSSFGFLTFTSEFDELVQVGQHGSL
jgi:hypothetical protein